MRIICIRKAEIKISLSIVSDLVYQSLGLAIYLIGEIVMYLTHLHIMCRDTEE